MNLKRIYESERIMNLRLMLNYSLQKKYFPAVIKEGQCTKAVA